mmetsp:Transcript_4262/g.12240  ORF Transcript_4262/g.12240 Transcript_4262/m.12240 type:complete len:316 (+) Transcript_4262:280-1227(+)
MVETTQVSGAEPYVSSGSSPKKSSKPKSAKKKKSSGQSKSSAYASSSSTYGASEPSKSSKVLEASGFSHFHQEATGIHQLSDGSGGTFRYAITGAESQIVTVELPPGKSCQGEPGSMMYLTSPIRMTVNCGGNCFGRLCGGEDCCILNFTNETNQVGYAALTTNDPLAKVVPVEMSSPEVAGTLIVQQGAYMASYGSVEISFDCDCNLVRCCCGGMGLVRQKLTGTGTAFLGAMGTVVQKVLAPGEVMLVDTNCLLGYSDSCTFEIKTTGGIVGWIGGGEGIFNASLKGPGLAIVQSTNMKLLLECLAANKMYRR